MDLPVEILSLCRVRTLLAEGAAREAPREAPRERQSTPAAVPATRRARAPSCAIDGPEPPTEEVAHPLAPQ